MVVSYRRFGTRVKQSKNCTLGLLEVGRTGCVDISISNYHSKQRKSPKVHRYNIHCCGSLKYGRHFVFHIRFMSTYKILFFIIIINIISHVSVIGRYDSIHALLHNTFHLTTHLYPLQKLRSTNQNSLPLHTIVNYIGTNLPSQTHHEDSEP
jgi:hypothetical protein